MLDTFTILLFFGWYLLALVVSEIMGKKSAVGTEWLFFLSVVTTPVGGLILALLFRKKE